MWQFFWCLVTLLYRSSRSVFISLCCFLHVTVFWCRATLVHRSWFLLLCCYVILHAGPLLMSLNTAVFYSGFPIMSLCCSLLGFCARTWQHWRIVGSPVMWMPSSAWVLCVYLATLMYWKVSQVLWCHYDSFCTGSFLADGEWQVWVLLLCDRVILYMGLLPVPGNTDAPYVWFCCYRCVCVCVCVCERERERERERVFSGSRVNGAKRGFHFSVYLH